MANTVKKVQKSVYPYYGAAATWVLYALLFDLYRVSHFLFVIVLSAGVYLAMRAFCKDQEVEAEVKPQKEKPTGNPELDKMIKNGHPGDEAAG